MPPNINPENDSANAFILTPADFADTGQWRLTIYLSQFGMRAFLRHAADSSRPAAELFNISWKSTEPALLLSLIENGIYDNPKVLDDYATEVIVETPFTAWAPTSLLDDEEGAEESVFEALFPGSDSEVSIDRIGEITALYSLAPGLEGFIARTMPGSRLRSHLAIIAERFAGKENPSQSISPRLYIDLRSGAADFVLLRGATLLSASMREWREEADILYNIFHLLQAYQIDPKECDVYLSGLKEERLSIAETLRQHTASASMTPVPAAAAEAALPLALTIRLCQNS